MFRFSLSIRFHLLQKTARKDKLQIGLLFLGSSLLKDKNISNLEKYPNSNNFLIIMILFSLQNFKNEKDEIQRELYFSFLSLSDL